MITAASTLCLSWLSLANADQVQTCPATHPWAGTLQQHFRAAKSRLLAAARTSVLAARSAALVHGLLYERIEDFARHGFGGSIVD